MQIYFKTKEYSFQFLIKIHCKRYFFRVCSLKTYQKRWQMQSIRKYLWKNNKKHEQIETLFRGLKSSGFNLEDTHVTHLDRFERLILLVIIAFVWCYKIGDYIDSSIKPIKIKKHGSRTVIIFRYGLNYLSRTMIILFLFSHTKQLN